MEKNKILIGAHVSIAGGIHNAILRGEALGCTCIQIFTKSSQCWTAPKITQEEANLFKKTLNFSTISTVIVHTSYLINLCSKNALIRKKSISALSHEIERCEQLDIPYLVLHPGSHTGLGEDTGLKLISENLDIILQKENPKVMVLLETVAGQGTNLGYTFEQLKQIRDLCKNKKYIGICIDTCHIFSAGYDISTKKDYNSVMSQFDKILGLETLKAMHINDSKTQLNSKKDRHENIGKGTIPLQAFEFIMNDPRLKNIPKILEIPVAKESDYAEQIELLKNMVK